MVEVRDRESKEKRVEKMGRGMRQRVVLGWGITCEKKSVMC